MNCLKRFLNITKSLLSLLGPLKMHLHSNS